MQVTETNNGLFINVSTEIQEIVSGGNWDKVIYDDVDTDFEQLTAALKFDIYSGPKGANVSQAFTFDKIDADADKVFKFYYPED
ncbi:CTB family bacteriocin [Nostoc parmelioides]|uniref:Uncharacterized protein n=1 Tax=Nostoc parmelioides FACHB-3921 TaxID=2692909 RepID=A0ABR8BGI0_9NOSO|nr:CTB family bacteriocin [Nostoc parmelioides]MBD2252083.1 hypothetical protein [Nostoc parmelioides FACHB-3921]